MVTPKLCTSNILLADDGSEHSQAAANLLCDLPLSADSHIKVLRVFAPSDAGNLWFYEKGLKKTATSLCENGKEVESEILAGHPAETIVNTAKKDNANMIVIGAKGLRATLGILLGGVVQQVAEHAECPVLVVRAPYKGLKRVLLVTDGSDASNKMLNCFSDFPMPEGVEYDILHVAPPIPSEQEIIQYWPSGIDISFTVPIDEIRQQIEERAAHEEAFGKEVLTQASATLSKQGVQAQIAFLRGDAATEVIEYAKEREIDLIICGGRGLGPFKGFILGSVSRKLLHYAPCSVMVVKNAG